MSKYLFNNYFIMPEKLKAPENNKEQKKETIKENKKETTENKQIINKENLPLYRDFLNKILWINKEAWTINKQNDSMKGKVLTITNIGREDGTWWWILTDAKVTGDITNKNQGWATIIQCSDGSMIKIDYIAPNLRPAEIRYTLLTAQQKEQYLNKVREREEALAKSNDTKEADKLIADM